MAASTARAYRNSEGRKSENPSLFSLRQLVESSTWPAEYRTLLLVMLEKNQFGTELWYSQQNLSRDLGKSYSTVRRMMRRLREGHRFGKKNVLHCAGVLEKTIDPNLRPNGVLRRSTTYRLHRQKLQSRPSREELESRSRGAFCPLPPRPDRPIPPAPAPAPSVPRDHRSPRREAPALNAKQRQELLARIDVYEQGRTEVRDAGGHLLRDLKPGDPSYIKPLPREMAKLAAANSMSRGDPARGFEGYGIAFEKARQAAEEMEGGP